MKKTIFIAIVSCLCIAALFSCSKNRFTVDYCGQKELFKNAKDSYKAGTRVKLYFDMIATDTDYRFYVDGASPEKVYYDEQKGYVIEFTMPAKDITVDVETKNSMTYVPEFNEGLLLVNYYTRTISADDNYSTYEIVLKEENNEYLIDEYSYDPENPIAVYSASNEVYERCMDVFDEYEMNKWQKREDLTSLEGKYIVVKIYDGKQHLRFTTDEIPSDGEEVFEKIRSILSEYMTKDNLL
ncbi:MAG: hypothetical protein IKM61_05805 [Eubacteriaceae bacterium]|nr:hypothetical protein [Eubacteriaceae bacterium]